MITFSARMYDITLQKYIDSSPNQYCIATCTNTTKLESLSLLDEGTTTTIFDLRDFDDVGSGPLNIATAFMFEAKRIYEDTGEYHELALQTTNSHNDYVLIWNHVAPNDLQLIVNLTYTAMQYFIPWDEGLTSQDVFHRQGHAFTSAHNIEELGQQTPLWQGSFYEDSNDNIITQLAYVSVAISVGNSDYYVYDPNTYLGRVGNTNLYKSFVGSALVFWRKYAGGDGAWKGPVLLVPAVNIHNEATGVDTRGSNLPGWDGRWHPRNDNANISKGEWSLVDDWWWGRRAASWTDKSFDTNGIPYYDSVVDSAEGWRSVITEVVHAASLTYTYRHVQLYYYLLGTFEPVDPEPPSDVDPTDIPPEDDPPIPIPPDDPDPYYDPTSDPENPVHDPTKDPKDPSYDPTTPHTPYRPPSDVDGGGPAPIQPIPGIVEIPTAPPAFVTNNSLFTLYNPSGGDLNNLANFLWSPTWSLDTLKKIFVNPMDCILGLMVMPQLPADVSTKEMNFGTIATGISMHFFTKQFCDFDCGTFKLEEFYMSYLDYAPYTKVSIFLPYIGEVELSTDEVMNKTIGVKYRFDISCGACVAFVSVDGNILYSFSGNCAAHLPLSANDWGSTVTALAAVPLAATKMGAMIGGGPIGALGAAAAISVMSMKEKVTHAGSLKGSAGLMGIQTPYLIVNRPRQAAPLNQNAYTGYPSFITESLGSLHGYTEVEECHLHNVPATHDELAEIERLLREGVMF